MTNVQDDDRITFDAIADQIGIRVSHQAPDIAFIRQRTLLGEVSQASNEALDAPANLHGRTWVSLSDIFGNGFDVLNGPAGLPDNHGVKLR